MPNVVTQPGYQQMQMRNRIAAQMMLQQQQQRAAQMAAQQRAFQVPVANPMQMLTQQDDLRRRQAVQEILEDQRTGV
jgi:hypothetical protein